jgi:hypothetical protein
MSQPSQQTVKLYKTDSDEFAVAWVASKEAERACLNGHTIKPHETHVKVYTRTIIDGKPVWKFDHRLCMQCVNRCEQCGKVILKQQNVRFCSEGCGEEHLRRETIGAEEREFWADENGEPET